MYKCQLQELCQKRHWTLPTYTSSKQGLDHNPSFSATVVVNGQTFHTHNFSKSSKEAQNEAAKIAFDYFSLLDPKAPKLPIPTASSFPQPSHLSSSGSLGAISEMDTIHAIRETFELKIQGSTAVVLEENKFRAVQHLYKSQLQTYAQKRNLIFPVYSCEREGPPHASRFRCRVTIDGKMYESPEFFPTLKEAEHAAAKVALMSLSPDGVQKDDYAFYKNLLQELVQKEGFRLPTYNTNRQGEAHCPVFVSTVEIEGEHFRGEEEKTKKHAEMSAAKAAYDALKARKSSQSPLVLLPSQRGQEAPQLLSSCSWSNISANVISNVPMNLSSCTIPVQQVEDCTGKGGLSSSDIYGDARDTIPSAPCESKSDSSSPSPSLSNSFANFVVDSSLEPSSNRITLTCKKVIVYPAKKPIPEGGTLLPMSDANWVAFSPPEARS